MLTSFEVDRGRWIHGTGGASSRLQRAEDGKRCCLGFLCIAAGVPERHIVNRIRPWSLGQHEGAALIPEPLMRTDVNAPAVGLMQDNDDPTLTDVVRERRLITGFKRIGIELTFTGRYDWTPR